MNIWHDNNLEIVQRHYTASTESYAVLLWAVINDCISNMHIHYKGGRQSKLQHSYHFVKGNIFITDYTPLSTPTQGVENNTCTLLPHVLPYTLVTHLFVEPGRMNGWVGLVGWPTADILIGP